MQQWVILFLGLLFAIPLSLLNSAIGRWWERRSERSRKTKAEKKARREDQNRRMSADAALFSTWLASRILIFLGYAFSLSFAANWIASASYLTRATKALAFVPILIYLLTHVLLLLNRVVDIYIKAEATSLSEYRKLESAAKVTNSHIERRPSDE